MPEASHRTPTPTTPRSTERRARRTCSVAAMLILAILAFGMGIGWLAQLVLGRGGRQTDWAMALIAGLAGSFVGGLLVSLLAGDGLRSDRAASSARSSARCSSPRSGSAVQDGSVPLTSC